jgi:hypothetical protein
MRPELRSEFLRPSVDTIAVTTERLGHPAVSVATAIESLRRITWSGHAAWEQVYQWHGNDGSRTADTLWFDVVTLQPLENHRHNGVQDAVTRFTRSLFRTVDPNRWPTPRFRGLYSPLASSPR